MKRVALAVLGLLFVLPSVAFPALADSTSPPPAPSAAASSGPGFVAVPTMTIFGRPNKPSVVILVKRPTAAAEAGAAHAALREAQLKAAEPAALRPH